MIRNFGDHAANERTFLAWVRTAIAVMAFGFIVEKFDLFLEIAAPSLAGREFGNISQEEYLHRAQELRDAPAGGPILEIAMPDGVITR